MAVAEDLGIDHDVVLYMKEPPDEATLRKIVAGLEDPVEDLVRKDSKFKKMELNADDYVDKGLIYQNPFIIWFNHNPESGYDGPVFESKDGALIVGGGLASIDVAKVLMLENTVAKLKERGIEEDLVEVQSRKLASVATRSSQSV